MARNTRAKKERKNSIVQISEYEYKKLKDKIQAFVMKRAFCIVIAAFWDKAELDWQKYFRSKKKMYEYLEDAVREVELYRGHVDTRKVVKVDQISQHVYEKTGIDYRTAWELCAREESEEFKREATK